MRNLVLPFLALLTIATATVAALRHDAPQAPTLPPKAPTAEALAQVSTQRHVRRLLHTRLGQPADLRIEGVRPSRMPQYAGATCGRVAWNDDGYRRFIATKRVVQIDGRTPDFDHAWQRICNGSPTMGLPPQTHATP